MPKSLQFALAAGSMLIFASTAMAQHVTVRVNPVFEVQPQISQEYHVLNITLDDVARARYATHVGHANSCTVHIGGQAPP
jgi:hypothetical protein